MPFWMWQEDLLGTCTGPHAQLQEEKALYGSVSRRGTITHIESEAGHGKENQIKQI